MPKTNSNTVKRHQLLKVVIDNKLLIQSTISRRDYFGGYHFVCNALDGAAKYMGTQEAAICSEDFTLHIHRSIFPQVTVTSWLKATYPRIILPYSENQDYRKAWVQAMYEACLKEDI